MKLGYRIVNVFTRPGEPLSGNPLCVFEDGRGLDEAMMQSLALQFNLSETTFILPCNEPDAQTTTQATARVRIFTPAMELPFAGHPTLGTAHVVRALYGASDAITLELAVGVIPVTAVGDNWTLQANAPVTRSFDAAQLPALASALGLTPHDFAAAPLWVNTGMEQLLVPLVSAGAVRAASPDAALAAFPNTPGKVSVYCFSPLEEAEMQVRFFFTKNAGSVAEDPATGSACANLGGYALANNAPLPLRRVLHQGEFVGRSSRLELEVDAMRAIRVSGEVIDIGRGVVEL